MDRLDEILSLVRGERWPFSQGIRTFKDGDGLPLHEDMLALERRGDVRRAKETDYYVQWIPTASRQHTGGPP